MEFNQSFEEWYAEHKHRTNTTSKEQTKEILQLAYEGGYTEGYDQGMTRVYKTL